MKVKDTDINSLFHTACRMVKKRISAYIDENFKKQLDMKLLSIGWSESEYVERAIVDYFPKFVELLKAMKEQG